MGKNFTIKQTFQDANGRHYLLGVAEDGDSFSLNTSDKGNVEVGHIIDVELDNLSGVEDQPVAPVAETPAPEAEQASVSSTDVAKAAE